MKKTLLLLLSAVTMVSCGKNPQAVVSGTLTGLSNDTLLLERVTTRERKVVDTAVTTSEGAFRFQVKLSASTPTFYNILHPSCSLPLLLSPGEKVTVNSLGDLARNYTVTGSQESESIKTFTLLFQQGINALDSLSSLYAQIPHSPDYDGRRRELARSYTNEYISFKRAQIAHVITHASEMASVYVLYKRLPNNEPLFNIESDLIYFRAVADSLEKRYPTSEYVVALRNEIKNQERAMEMAIKINEAANSTLPFPELELPDMYNQPQNLSTLLGAVILVDFWAPHMTESAILNAEYKELYEAFAVKGLKIYQVAITPDKANWISALQAQKLPWISVIEPQGMHSNSTISYNVGGLPSNILIDQTGNIIGRNLYGAMLQKKLAGLFR